MVYWVPRLYPNGGKGSAPCEKSVCRQVGFVLRSRNSDCPEPQIRFAYLDRSRAPKSVRRHSEELSTHADGGLFRRANWDLHGAGSSGAGIVRALTACVRLSRCQWSQPARGPTFRNRISADCGRPRCEKAKSWSCFCARQFIWKVAVVAHATVEDLGRGCK